MDNNMVEQNYNYSKLPVPSKMIKQEIDGLYGQSVLRELGNLIRFYDIYEKGADFFVDATGESSQGNLRYKNARTLVNKEARFLFSKVPDFNIRLKNGDQNSDEYKVKNTIMQNFLDNVIQKNHIGKNLVKAAKDCFIAKRIAIALNFSDDGIAINFINALEFVYDVDETDLDRITKLVCFYTIKDDKFDKKEQRIYKKKYWLENGVCKIDEAIYDGTGDLVEEVVLGMVTKFTYIPAVVVINDGLTGDIAGSSEIEQLSEFESWYSRLSNADIDAERKSMNPVRYSIDMDTNTTSGLSVSPGSFWDMQSDNNVGEGSIGKVGILESSMGYSGALDITLKRIKTNMYKQIDMPEVEEIQAQLSSGKALQSIYWGLTVRCDEKMLTWQPALEFMCRAIIEGAFLYPNSIAKYTDEKLVDEEFDVEVINHYALPTDEVEEINVDLSKVLASTFSRKSFMKKWEGYTDEQVDAELEQIAREKDILENSVMMPPLDTSTNTGIADEGLEEIVVNEE